MGIQKSPPFGLADLTTGDAKKAGRVIGAMMTMKKTDMQALKNAAAG
jgi:hypothetical protein